MRAPGTGGAPPPGSGTSDGRTSDAPAHVLTLRPNDSLFPKALRAVRPEVEVLYALGDLTLLERPIVAIVGSREPTNYGIKVAYEAAREAARAGLVVVSGMARGLDARAHRGALDGGGKTIAVLGCGIGVPYPKENLALLRSIPEHGLLLSEYPPGERPSKWSFPARNRIIVALAKCLLVVEGRAKGGTSNTVRWMAELGRSVLAVPGRIDEPVAEGPNRLIQDGAWPYLTPQDLLQHFGLVWDGLNGAAEGAGEPARTDRRRPDAGASRAPVPLDDDVLAALSGLAAAEAAVFDVVTPEPVHVDRLAERAGLEPATLLAALSSLEIKGLVAQLPGKQFRLAS